MRWHRAVGVAACDRCEADIHDFRSPGPSVELRAIADPLLDLLAPEPIRHERVVASLHPDLKALGRGAIFELGWRLASALGAPAGERSRGRQHGLAADRITETLVEGGRLIAGWPHAFRNHLEDLGGRGDAATLAQTVARVRRDLHRRRTWPEIAGLLESAMPDVFGRTGVKSRSAALAHAPGFVNGSGASRLLGLGSRKFVAVHRADLLTPAFVTGTPNRCMAIETAELEQARLALADRLPRGTVKKRLGVTSRGVEQLVCLGALHVIDDPVVRITHPGIQISRASLNLLTSNLERAAVSVYWDEPLVSVAAALSGIGGEKLYGPVIVAMAEGRLRFVLMEGPRPLLDRTLVSGKDAANLRSFRFVPASYPDFAFEDTITRKDAADVLNASPALMMQILGEELAHDRAEGTLLVRSAVVGLARQRISSREVHIRWSGGRRRLPDQLRQDGARAKLGPAGWDRREVEQAMEPR